MKLIMVVPYFQPRVGGVETYTWQLATQLVDLGWEVVIVTTRDGGKPAWVRRDTVAGMAVYYLPVAVSVSNTPVGLGWRRKLRRIYAAERPDVINAHTPVPYLADLAQRASKSIPFVLTYHNDLYKEALVQKILVQIIQLTLIRRTLSRSTRIIATSDYYVGESRYLSAHRRKVSIVPPGVDLARFNPDIAVSQDLAERFAGRRVLLFVGSLNNSQQHKGLDLLIAAFARLRASHQELALVVVGQGDGLRRYQNLASAANVGADVSFEGYVSDARLVQYYKLAHIFVMPSTDRSEGFGLVYAEAGAMGLPVIGARIGGVPYSVLDGRTGLLVEPGSVADLCEALRRLLADEDLARRLGQAGAARARTEFDWLPLAERTSEIFKELAG